MKQIFPLFVTAILLFCFVTFAVAQSPRRVIIDTDPGIDDAFALLLAINSPELEIEGHSSDSLITAMLEKIEAPRT